MLVDGEVKVRPAGCPAAEHGCEAVDCHAELLAAGLSCSEPSCCLPVAADASQLHQASQALLRVQLLAGCMEGTRQQVHWQGRCRQGQVRAGTIEGAVPGRKAGLPQASARVVRRAGMCQSCLQTGEICK